MGSKSTASTGESAAASRVMNAMLGAFSLATPTSSFNTSATPEKSAPMNRSNVSCALR